jgi:septum formation protein
MKEIILASASPRRVELLKQVGLDFRVFPSNIEEKIPSGISPEETVQELAYQKALNVTQQLKRPAIVIGADTIVFKNGILGKPTDEHNAFTMLKNLQGDWHDVITGITIIDSGSMKYIKCFEKTHVKMKELNDNVIKSYLRTGECMDKAGAYGIQGIGATMIEKIEGCYFNVVGLPLAKLCLALGKFGIHVLKE